jgi:translocator protein
MARRSLWALAGFCGACAATALLGARATLRNKRWYRTLKKPAFTPPDSLFGPVWTALYALMSISAYRVWRAPPSTERSRALGLWGAQLAANAAWSPLFFGAHRPRAALADLTLLLSAVGLYSSQARRVDAPAAWMMVPYLAWAGFATVLNGEIVRRNPN